MSNNEELNKELAALNLSQVKTSSPFICAGDPPKPLLILENICRVVETDETLKEKFRYNEFSYMVEVNKDGVWDVMQDIDIIETRRYIAQNYSSFVRASKDMVLDAIVSLAHKRKVNPPKDYLTGLVWDGEARLDTWLHHAFGVANDDTYAAIGSNWMKGLVKRVLHPGCQFDEVLVLEGEQGWRKSSSLRALGKPWHVETTYTGDKDFFLALAKNIIVEFSEGDIFSRASVRAIKALITKTEDQYRLPYERSVQTLKRGCVFAMTTNDSQYLKDETGNRRWLPVKLGRVADIEWIVDNRDQLYAEAVHRVEVLRETTWEYPQEALKAMQEDRMEHEAYMEEIEDWYLSLSIERRDKGLTLQDVYSAVYLKYQNNGPKMKKEDEWEISRILRKMGIERRVVKLDTKSAKRWIYTTETQKRYIDRWENEVVNPDDF